MLSPMTRYLDWSYSIHILIYRYSNVTTGVLSNSFPVEVQIIVRYSFSDLEEFPDLLIEPCSIIYAYEN